MNEFIIHFGMHKTGSSSIQQSLSANLADHRFHYLNLGATKNPGTANSSKAIVAAFSNSAEHHHGNVKRGQSPVELQVQKTAIRARFARQLTDCKAHAILSAEAICGLTAEELGELQAMPSSIGFRCKAVGYIRPPKSFMESAFQQQVKGGRKRLSLANLFPHYQKKLSRIESVWGAENVSFWLFSLKRFPNQCVVQDFCRQLGITFRPEGVIETNRSLSLPAVSLLFAYNNFGPGYGTGAAAVRENRVLLARVQALLGPTLRFHSSMVEPILKANRSDIAWAEERLGESLTEEIRANDGMSIRGEEDLLAFAPETLQWLALQLGPDYEKRWHPSMTPQEVAEWMHALRLKLASDDEVLMKRQLRASRSNRSDA